MTALHTRLPRWWWPVAYLALITLPVAALLLGRRPAGAGFWWDLALALGYVAMAMTGTQFALTARFKRVAAPFGIDLVYRFHHYLGVVILLFIAAHAVILLGKYPGAAGSLRQVPPAHIAAAWVGLLALGALAVSSIWRRRLRIDYDSWRRVHVGLAVVALLAAALHIQASGSYLQSLPKSLLWAALVAFWLGLAVFVRLLRPLMLLRRPWRVVAVRPEHGQSWTLTLEPCRGRPFPYRAGQFVWLTLRASPFAMREHPFSLSSVPASDSGVQVTVKALGDFTAQVVDIEPGELAYVDGPYGAFTLEHLSGATGVVFIAGGAGIAPVMSMLRSLADRADGRPLWLFYGNRRWEHVVFREELAELTRKLNLKLVHVLGEPPDSWRGERGLIDAHLLARYLPQRRASLEYLVCGPEPMMRTVERDLVELGIPRRRLHSELFNLA